MKAIKIVLSNSHLEYLIDEALIQGYHGLDTTMENVVSRVLGDIITAKIKRDLPSRANIIERLKGGEA